MRGAKVKINTPDEIAMSRAAGKLAAAVLDMITPHVKPGVSTEELDKLCHDYIVDELKAIPANIGYHGFPKTIVCFGESRGLSWYSVADKNSEKRRHR
jgi:methionyl aminopeptidase